MEKKISDYLHLYLGCEVISTAKKPGTKRYILSAVTNDGLYEFKTIPEGFSMFLSEWKPLLRPLSDMTEEEKDEVGLIDDHAVFEMGNESSMAGYIMPDVFVWLLSKGFDLFGLIKSGLAIDKTTLTK